MIITLNKRIRAVPEAIAGKSGEKALGYSMDAVVVYIHPLGRFYTLEFTAGGSKATFRESTYFSAADFEETRRAGIFRDIAANTHPRKVSMQNLPSDTLADGYYDERPESMDTEFDEAMV